MAFKSKRPLIKFIKCSEMANAKVKIEKPIDTTELEKMMHSALSKYIKELQRKPHPEKQVIDMTKIGESIKQQINQSLSDKLIQEQFGGKINSQIDDKLNALMIAIKDIQLKGGSMEDIKKIVPNVDLAELAKITQQGVEFITEGIQDSQSKKIKKIKLETNAADLARELE